MACRCGKEFCYWCGACEINSHRCINGCPQFGFNDPLNKMRDYNMREPTTEEIAKNEEIN
jgi:hypothetical protein